MRGQKGNRLRGHERVEVDGRDNGTCPTHGSESQSPSQQKHLRDNHVVWRDGTESILEL